MNIKRLIQLVDDLSVPKDEREIVLREIRKIEKAEGRSYYMKPEDNAQFKKHMEKAKRKNKNPPK